jgi:hypothetical protein
MFTQGWGGQYYEHDEKGRTDCVLMRLEVENSWTLRCYTHHTEWITS